MTIICACCKIIPTTYIMIRRHPYCMKCKQEYFEQELKKLKEEFVC